MIEKRLSAAGQSHLLQFEQELSEDRALALRQQLEAIDFDQLSRLVGNEDKTVDWEALAKRAEPPPAARLSDANPAISEADALQAGEQALRAGKVGMILVAGGQGSRLGFDLPKGMFPIGPISDRTLFQMHCDRLLAVMKRYGVSIPMFIMTSPATDAETRQYFQEHELLGLSESQCRVFCQGTMPAVDAKSGKILLASKDSLALSPDGHGGLVAALDKNGCLAEARAAGIDYFYYAQVDNPLAQLCDPKLIGYHILAKSQLTTQVVQKRFATEKVGNVVSVDGTVQIIEYSDLPQEVAERTHADGTLKLWAGNIAVHVFDRSFLESVVDSADGLPFHRAHKKVPYVDATGTLVEPGETNAIKFERFVFDLLPMADRAYVVEGLAADIFAPVKNADGAPMDTPATSKQAILDQHKRWLIAAGAEVADGVRVEIHPDWALDEAGVRERLANTTDTAKFTCDTFLR